MTCILCILTDVIHCISRFRMLCHILIHYPFILFMYLHSDYCIIPASVNSVMFLICSVFTCILPPRHPSSVVPVGRTFHRTSIQGVTGSGSSHLVSEHRFSTRDG